MSHGQIIAVLAVLVLIAWLSMRRRPVSTVLVYGGSFADDSPRARQIKAREAVAAALEPKQEGKK